MDDEEFLPMMAWWQAMYNALLDINDDSVVGLRHFQQSCRVVNLDHWKDMWGQGLATETMQRTAGYNRFVKVVDVGMTQTALDQFMDVFQVMRLEAQRLSHNQVYKIWAVIAIVASSLLYLDQFDETPLYLIQRVREDDPRRVRVFIQRFADVERLKDRVIDLFALTEDELERMMAFHPNSGHLTVQELAPNTKKEHHHRKEAFAAARSAPPLLPHDAKRAKAAATDSAVAGLIRKVVDMYV